VIPYPPAEMVSGSGVYDERPYAGSADLPALIRFASDATRLRLPHDATWHPGDFVWELKGAYDAPHNMRLWRSGAEVVAVAWLISPGELWLEALPGHEPLVPEMVAWAEAASGACPARVRAGGDPRRVAALEAMGYQRAGPQGVHFRLDLRRALLDALPPQGAVAIDCVDIDAEARAACHRAAWDDLAHIGLPHARSTFTAELYRALRAAPTYDPRLDILVRDASGELVANCICWVDAGSGIGTFEPVGTRAAFRGRGFARAAVVEGLRRLQSRGMTFARVGTAHFNAPAIATYRSCGFTIIDRTDWWARPAAA